MAPGSTRADTPVPGGEVSGVWTAAGSPYLINGEISVPVGQTLTIEPGVEVRFQGWYRFVVRGCLLAIGTVNDTIRIRAEVPATGWHSLRFLETETNAQPRSEVRYCRIEDGYAWGTCPDNSGGGILIDRSTVTVANCLIRDNEAVNGLADWGGGGIYCDSASSVSILDNVICENHTDHDGGGIYCRLSSPTIHGNTITGNTALRGAGLACFNFASPDVRGNTISDNHGEGVYLSGGFAWLVNNTIADNAGSGVHCYLTNPYLIGNLIRGNAAVRGGGLHNEGSSPQVVNNTIVGNTATSQGGGVYNASVMVGVVQPSNPSCTNDILWGNTAPDGPQMCSGTNCIAAVRYSDIEDFSGAGCVGAVSTGPGMIEDPPLFDSGGPYPQALTAGSPCRDTGMPSTPNLPELDLAGHDRVVNGRVDMGAYEYAAGVAVPGATPPATRILAQNRPNPFNPRTVITFTVDRPQHLTLAVFDAAGRHVATLLEGRVAAGSGAVAWDGTDDHGNAVPSGLYLYRAILAGGEVETRAMTLVR
jgi:hypothetical protein